jgi:dTDP-4-amino-4,6-dideoxygalactose transaminase
MGIGFQRNILEERHAKHLFVVTLPLENMDLTRDDFILEMRRRNVGASIHYAPLHHMPLYYPDRQPTLPVTEWLTIRNVTLPIGASMSLQDVDYVCTNSLELLQH